MSEFNLTPTIVGGGTFKTGFTSDQKHITGNIDVVNATSFKAKFTSDQKKMAGDMGVVNATSDNYNDLSNKPSINGVILIGNKTSEELNIAGDKTFVYTQAVSSDVWEIQHNLDKYPAVVVVDSGNSVVVGEIVYIDKNNVRITFTSVFSGKAYFN